MLVLVNRQRLSHFESFPRITLHISIFFSLLSRRRSGWPARRRRPKRSLDRKNLESLTGSWHNIHFSYFSLISYLLSFVHIIDAFWRLSEMTFPNFQVAYSCWWDEGGCQNVGLSQKSKLVDFFIFLESASKNCQKIGFPDIVWSGARAPWPSRDRKNKKKKIVFELRVYLFSIYSFMEIGLKR